VEREVGQRVGGTQGQRSSGRFPIGSRAHAERWAQWQIERAGVAAAAAVAIIAARVIALRREVLG